jgi:outer membrane protein TolC
MRHTKSELAPTDHAVSLNHLAEVWKNGAKRLRRDGTKLIAHLLVISMTLSSTGGCSLIRKVSPGHHDTHASYHDDYGLRIEYPEVAECATPQATAAKQAMEPLALQDPSELPTLDMSLQEAINLAVQQSPVLRTLGGSADVRLSPQGISTVYDPALTAASPTQGTEAALAAFDAQYTQQLFWQKVDQPRNSQNFAAPGFVVANISDRNLATFTSELSKTTALGSQFALRHNVNYTDVNDPSKSARLFKSDFNGWLEAEWRQPLLQGAGSTFNRIAGPTAVPGQYNGVLIARVNEDVSLADFETNVIQLVSDVEQTYWDLVAAYRVLDTLVKGRAAALQTFQYQQVRLEVGTGRADEEAQARSQYFDFQAQTEAALGGPTGLYQVEQRLRYLVGLPATDGRLIRPSTEPTDTKVVFDWESALAQALDRRVEVRRQRLSVKRRELELIAARLNVRPRLDFLGQYRWRGLGNHLIGDSDGGSLNNMYAEITGGNYQEAQAGFELSFPVGFRTASLALSHARLNVQRERAVLAETELFISHDLSDAARQVALTHQLLETNYSRFIADLRQVDVLRRRWVDGNDNINFYLQAQRQVVNSASQFYQALTNYNLAIRDFHREKGSLLAYNHVHMAEGPWAAGATSDAHQVGRFLHPRYFPSKTSVPTPITSGPFDPSEVQNTSGDAGEEDLPFPFDILNENGDPLSAPLGGLQIDNLMPSDPIEYVTPVSATGDAEQN